MTSHSHYVQTILVTMPWTNHWLRTTSSLLFTKWVVPTHTFVTSIGYKEDWLWLNPHLFMLNPSWVVLVGNILLGPNYWDFLTLYVTHTPYQDWANFIIVSLGQDECTTFLQIFPNLLCRDPYVHCSPWVDFTQLMIYTVGLIGPCEYSSPAPLRQLFDSLVNPPQVKELHWDFPKSRSDSLVNLPKWRNSIEIFPNLARAPSKKNILLFPMVYSDPWSKGTPLRFAKSHKSSLKSIIPNISHSMVIPWNPHWSMRVFITWTSGMAFTL